MKLGGNPVCAELGDDFGWLYLPICFEKSKGSFQMKFWPVFLYAVMFSAIFVAGVFILFASSFVTDADILNIENEINEIGVGEFRDPSIRVDLLIR
ncbi:hypothetical protein MHBO_001924 [Bonamia ostreae]|uniref:Uncharacterized protein n=1 Tax=Bonamia ostreae TaxID=126728 RepID=A0ABV2AKS0_9EUKA